MARIMQILDGPSQHYAEDRDFLLEHGLRPGNVNREWTEVGTITRNDVDDEGQFDEPAWSIKIEASALPAKFWRFTITRPRYLSESKSYEMETLVLGTGSGKLVDYWPTALNFAWNMLSVNDPEDLDEVS